MKSSNIFSTSDFVNIVNGVEIMCSVQRIITYIEVPSKSVETKFANKGKYMKLVTIA